MAIIKLRNTSKGERLYGDGDKMIHFGHISALGLINTKQPDIEITEKQFSALMKTFAFKKDLEAGVIERRY